MIALIACSSQKLARPAPARELYTSQLFQKSLAYADRTCDRAYVVSALHGLVELERELAPYNVRLGRDREQRTWWARRIVEQLVARHGRWNYFVILAGADYAVPIRAELRAFDDNPDVAPIVIEPLAGMQIGERLSFLKAQTSGTPARSTNLEVPAPRVAARPAAILSSSCTPTTPAVAAKPAPSRRSSP